MLADVIVEPVEYRVSLVPNTYPEARIWSLTVARRGEDRWAVLFGGQCLGKRGNWSYEPIPSSRTDRWKNAYRHDLGTALRLAREAAATVKTNGLTAEEYMRWYDSHRRRTG